MTQDVVNCGGETRYYRCVFHLSDSCTGRQENIHVDINSSVDQKLYLRLFHLSDSCTGRQKKYTTIVNCD